MSNGTENIRIVIYSGEYRLTINVQYGTVLSNQLNAEGNMNYLTIVAAVFGTIWGVFFLLLFHYVVFTVIGIFKKKSFPHTDEKKCYGVVIGARNEEAVIGALIDSICANRYPQDKIRIFVVAHNCTDKTAEIARGKGAVVYEYNNPNERTLGYAYRYLYGKINAEWGWKNFDGFLVMNADNIMPPDYISKMNDAFVATGGERVITSYRNSSNFGSNYMSCLYGVFFISCCRYEMRGRTYCGCTTRISGTGYLFPSETVKDGWPYVTITEDWEFSADRVADGVKIYYCDDAEFYDEQPTTVPIMWRQRLRWARGHMVVFFTRFRKLVRNLFTPVSRGGPKNKFSIFDMTLSIMPLGVISTCLAVLNIVCIALSPLFGYSAAEVWLHYGLSILIGFACTYAVGVLMAVLLVAVERRRIPKVRFWTMAAAVLLWPFFIALNILLDVISLFVRKLEWKTIPHRGAADKGKAPRQKEEEPPCRMQAAGENENI